MESTQAAPAAHSAPHISPRTYVIVFGWLTLFTAVEVLIASSALAESVKVALLVTLAVIKAALVVLYYMHLRYDNRWYWLTLLVPIGFVILLARFLLLLNSKPTP